MSSLLLLVDGYNVIAPVAAPARDPDSRWLQRERMQLIQRIVSHLDPQVRRRTCVVFDAADPPPDRPDAFEVEGIEVLFAVGYPEADDLLEELISAHTAPKTLTVVSSDQRVQTAARRRGCRIHEAQPWLDDLMEGRFRQPTQSSGAGQGGPTQGSEKPQGTVEPSEIDRWMDEFGF